MGRNRRDHRRAPRKAITIYSGCSRRDADGYRNGKAREMSDGETVMTMQQAANYVGYKSTKRFGGWVRRHKVPYELRGTQKIFLKSILDRWLVKIAQATARKVYP